MRKLLLPTRPGENALYARLRDSLDPHAVERRDFFAKLWEQFEPLAPKGFQKKLQIEFHQRWWEMYLTVALCRLGLKPRCPKADEGPDITIDISNWKVFIEATAPSIGITSDRVPEVFSNGVQYFPERECLLRLTQALTDKRTKFDQYIKSERIPINSACVVALSSCALNQFGTLLDGVHPAPLSVLAGAGPPVVTFGGSRPPYTSRRDILKRDSEREVNVCLFDTPEFRIISAVLYSPIDLWNAPLDTEKTISLFLNPNPINPLPASFTCRFEHWFQESLSQDQRTWKRIQQIYSEKP